MGARKSQKAKKPRLIIDFYWKDRHGKSHRFRKVPELRTATGLKLETERLLLNVAKYGSPYEPKTECMTVREFVDAHYREWMTANLKPYTLYTRGCTIRNHLLPEFGAERLDAITAERLNRYVASLIAKGISPPSRVNVLKSILSVAVELGKLPQMPTFVLPRKAHRLHDCPTSQEVDAIMREMSGWMKPAIALAVYAGLRTGEIRALQVGDVDWARNRLCVRRGMSYKTLTTTKGNNERLVPIAPELASILVEACKGKRATDWVATSYRGNQLGVNSLFGGLSKWLRRHCMTHRSVHSLRHAFCSRLLERGATVEMVRAVAGHSNIATTSIYLHSRMEDVVPFMGNSWSSSMSVVAQ